MAGEKFRVLIATTNGPVEVLLLTEEDPAIGRSVACIGGTTETADIASAYHAFVARPTGIIARLFGHACYRLDVSGRIDAGTSWQLGVLAAHALHAAGRLAQEKDGAEGVLWASGSVRPVDLTIGAVNHLTEKVQTSRARLSDEVAAGRRVIIAVPAQNAEEISYALETDFAPGGIELLEVSAAAELCDRLGIALPEKSEPKTVRADAQQTNTASPPLRRRRVWLTAGLGIVAAAAAAAYLLIRPPATVADSPLPQAPPRQEAEKLVPETVPFISARDQGAIRSTYLPAPDYKALAISANRIGFSTAQRDQATAQTGALDACQRASDAAPVRTTCELYAVGDIVVARRGRPPLPPQPWLIRDPSIERPFTAKDIPLVSETTRTRIEKEFGGGGNPRALALSQNGYAVAYVSETSIEEVVRRSLERCGSNSGAACMIIAIDGTFVVPIPASARVVGFARSGLPDTIAPDLRESVARRLGNATRGWNAVAVGAGGRVGMRLGAEAERPAVDDALADCGRHDRECRIAVIGPFVVESMPIADATLTPVAITAPPNRPTLEDELMAALASAVPTLDASAREDLARRYVATTNHKILAVVPGTTKRWRTGEWPTTEAAEELGLERCQVFHAKPCALIAVDDSVQAPADGHWAPRDMPRAGYAGTFAPERIPGITKEVRDRADIAGYRNAPAPKAAAYHPWGLVFTAVSAENQRAAEARALSACNADPIRRGRHGPCRLYAVGDQVVLPRRETKPATP